MGLAVSIKYTLYYNFCCLPFVAKTYEFSHLGATTLSIMTFSITTLNIKGLLVTFTITTQHNDTLIVLNVIMLKVVMLNVVILSVEAPSRAFDKLGHFFYFLKFYFKKNTIQQILLEYLPTE